jgi:hypothetical protein
MILQENNFKRKCFTSQKLFQTENVNSIKDALCQLNGVTHAHESIVIVARYYSPFHVSVTQITPEPGVI